MEIQDVSAYLPHRPPIVLIDRVIDIEPCQTGVGIKHFQHDDSFFQGHFPDHPILPGVYVIEAFAQTALVVLIAKTPSKTPPVGFLAKVENMSFYRSIVPEQTITFTIRVNKKIGAFIMIDCLAECAGVRCARGEIVLSINTDSTL